MTDDEVLAVIGHEIGHVVHQDTKHAMKNAYLRSAAKNVAGAVSETASKLTDSQLGALAEAFMGAQFSQKQDSPLMITLLIFAFNKRLIPTPCQKH